MMSEQSKANLRYLEYAKTLKGKVCGRWTIGDYVYRGEGRFGTRFYECHCSCGKMVVREVCRLLRGTSNSCGCLQKEIVSKLLTQDIGQTKYPKEYRSWNGMKSRCLNPNIPAYKRYGGRGITVSKRWVNSFANFLTDMGKMPDGKYSLDRIDNEKGYCKSNCRWATDEQQAQNTSSCIYVTHNGETKVLSVWSREYGISLFTLIHRHKNGLTGDALFTKKKYSKRGYASGFAKQK